MPRMTHATTPAARLPPLPAAGPSDVPPVLVEAWRGPIVESRHRGSIAVVDAQGQVCWQAGWIDRPVFPRSAVKLLQALPLVASGAAEAWGLDDAALALACASHGGEPAHVATAAAVLQRAGLGAQALACGAHWPSHEASSRQLARTGREPQALHNNCSGKHAGFLALGAWLARRQGDPDPAAFVHGYTERTHPVMRAVQQALAEATGGNVVDAPWAIDGCSIPTLGQPLRELAQGFARVATGQGLSAPLAQAALRLRRAIAAQPFMVAGSGRFDSEVMAHFGERVCCKVGAEGVYCAALPEVGLGIALKMEDGTSARAAEVVMAGLLAHLVARDAADHGVLSRWRPVSLRNWNGLAVGRLATVAGWLTD